MSDAEVKTALAALTAATPAYVEAEQFYDGKEPEVFASNRIRQLLGSHGKKMRLQFAAVPVDVVADRLSVAALTASTPEGQAVIDEVYEDNAFGIETKDLIRSASKLGDAYVLVLPDEDAQVSGVAMYRHDAKSMRVFYRDDQPRVKSHAVHWWVEKTPEGRKVRVNMYWPDRSEPWESVEVVPDGQPATLADYQYRLIDTEDLRTEVNEYGVVPVFHFRTGGQYGVPEHATAYGPQRMIDKATATLMAAVDKAGFPQRYALTDASVSTARFDQPGGFGTGDDQVVTTDQVADANLAEMRRADPGDTWLLEGVRSVGQFTAADADNFTGTVEKLLRWMASTSGVPLFHFEPAAGFPSGASRIAAETAVNNRARDRQDRYGVEARAMWAHVLRVRGVQGAVVQVQWAPLMQLSDTESLEAAKLKIEMGVPVEVVMQEIGYLPSVVESWGLVSGGGPVE